MVEAIQSMVVVEKEEYSNLIVAQEHLRNIYKMAINGAELSWNKTDIRLDTDAVEKYLKSICSDECKLKYEELKKELTAEEANGQPDNN